MAFLSFIKLLLVIISAITMHRPPIFISALILSKKNYLSIPIYEF